MLIFVITSGFPNEINLNSGIFVHEQCNMLKKKGHGIVVLDASGYGWRNWNQKTCSKVEISILEGIPVIANHYRSIASSRLPQLSVLNYMRKLRKIYDLAIKEYGKPDLFHAHFAFLAGYGAYLLSKENNVPYIVTEHYSLFLQKTLNPEIQKMLSQTVENAEEFICVSTVLKKAIMKWTNTKKNISVIPNMIDDRFKYYPNPNYPKLNVFSFFSAGNLTKSKGIDILIRAFIMTFARNEKVILKIAGDGEEYKKLQKMIDTSKREHQIILLGRLSRDEILEEYIKCDCFVLPSKFETFGMVYREAMAVGRPVISTKNGGIEDGWHDEFGKLIDSSNPIDIGYAMRYVYEHLSEYDGERISKECINLYSATRIYDELSEIYSRIVKRD